MSGTINVACYDCGHYLADNCQGKPEKCGDFRNADTLRKTPAGNPPDDRPSEPQDPHHPPVILVETPAEPVVPTIPAALTPKQKDFERLVARRMEVFQHQMKLFGNLVGPNYKPTAEQVRQLEAEITKAAGVFTSHALAYLERLPA